MNCTVCGGKLRIENGFYVCENCGNRKKISAFFEDTDVFICYVENDAQGRRTKDSMLAQELYNKLTGYNIKCFYERISVADLSEAEYQNICDEAMQKSKIAIVLSISSNNFKKIITDNLYRFDKKTVIPIYSEMNVHDIPKELKSLQCVNYNDIGATEILAKRILQILGRENELGIAEFTTEQQRKRKKKVILILCIVLILFLGIGAYVFCGTPYVLKSKKYTYAEKLFIGGKNTLAIKQLLEIGDYSDSQILLKKIYDQYTGYYNAENDSCAIYFKISDNLKLTLEVTYYSDEGGMVSFSSEAILNDKNSKYQFVDNLRNLGNYSIVLFDDGFELAVHTEDKNDDLYIKDFSHTFKISEKTDAPLQKKLDRGLIINWLKNGISKEDLIAQGYELKKLYQLNDGVDEYLYIITNTDIKVAVFTDYYTYGKETNEISGLLIPAKIIIPDKIGMNDTVIFEDDILYVPNGNVGKGISLGDSKGVINKDTIVAVTSRQLIDRAYGGIGKTIENIIEDNCLF